MFSRSLRSLVSLKLRDTAIQRLELLNAGKSAPVALRVQVEAGGCSGFQYKLNLVPASSAGLEDTVIESGVAKLLVDKTSAKFLEDAEIDYKEEMVRSAFVVVANKTTFSFVEWVNHMEKLELLRSQCRLVLASESKPRAAVLSQVGLPFEAVSSEFPEDLEKRKYSPENYAQTNARIKAELVSKKLRLGEDKVLIVIGCDTVIQDTDNKIVEKPADAADAKRILKSLSGKTHRVITGVSIVITAQRGLKVVQHEFAETTHVRFANIADHALDVYIASGETFNKAGAYGIQGLGALFIESIEGDYNNVVGIPLFRIFSTINTVIDDLLG